MILKGLGVFYKFAPHNYLRAENTTHSTLDYVTLSGALTNSAPCTIAALQKLFAIMHRTICDPAIPPLREHFAGRHPDSIAESAQLAAKSTAPDRLSIYGYKHVTEKQTPARTHPIERPEATAHID
ncbi:hypothetical protein [Thalassospira indica]|uniref:Uncharacterized protein n=1 Tax=Thalassospira indica TaxID=1891279 RepID=A0ABM6XV71_9PROT|nr:hypothetical protein [Thalassospira indica]AXO13557.1 hypothetical protein DY252_04510 [Thalassospira indica]OAZ14558.1 hypothetical protein TH15_01730 [Thalassospira profundimaris]